MTTQLEDPFARFAPVPPPPPGRLARALAVLGHEWTLATVASVVLAILMTWPTLRDPATTIPEDAIDPALQAWQMAWSGHALLTDPGALWHGNGFFPERYSFAFSDTLLGYAPAGLFGTGPAAAVVRYNIMFVLAHALAFLGAYALVRQLGSGRTGAVVAGLAFAYAPWRLAQAGHLHVLSSGGIALALAMLARGHGWSLRHGYRPERRRPGWAYAGWWVAAWQISLGFGIGLAFGYVLAVCCLVAAGWWAVRRVRGGRDAAPFGSRLLAADLGGGLVFAATGLALSIPYYRVAELHPYAKRTTELLDSFSPPLGGFLTAPATNLLWGGRHATLREHLAWPPEMAMLPGYALYALAATGLAFSVWSLRQRLMLLAGVVVTVALSMGTRMVGGGQVGYLLLFEYLPGWEGVRTPGRLILWTTLLLGILAAGGVTEVLRRAWRLHRQLTNRDLAGWLRLAAVLPVAAVLAEGLNTTPHPRVPVQPAAVRQAQPPYLILPSDFRTDSQALLWSTDDFGRMVNGNSGFTPASLERTREATARFPDPASIAHLRESGVRTVVVLRGLVVGTPWQDAPDAPVDGLGITRTDVNGDVVFQLG